MLTKAFVVPAIAALAIFTEIANAHSWVECVDWRFKKTGNTAATRFVDGQGDCFGFARNFPLGHKFGTLDSADPNRHYQQAHPPIDPIACSVGPRKKGDPQRQKGEEVGSNERKPNPVTSAYGTSSRVSKIGVMTTITADRRQLCVRWPSKNHATKDEVNNPVDIYFVPAADETLFMKQSELLKKVVFNTKLDYKACSPPKNGDQDKRACGGCFDVPASVEAGSYLMQWRWELNPGEFYTSCADIQVQ